MSKLTTQQLELAQEMRDSGITYEVIASYFGVTTKQLLKHRKGYEQHNKILRANATG